MLRERYFADPLSFPLLNRSHQNAKTKSSVWKQIEAHQSFVTAKRISWMRPQLQSNCGFGNVKGVVISTLDRGFQSQEYFCGTIMHWQPISEERRVQKNNWIAVLCVHFWIFFKHYWYWKYWIHETAYAVNKHEYLASLSVKRRCILWCYESCLHFMISQTKTTPTLCAQVQELVHACFALLPRVFHCYLIRFQKSGCEWLRVCSSWHKYF